MTFIPAFVLQGSSSHLYLVNACELELCPCSFCGSVERRLGKNMLWMALRKHAIAVARIKDQVHYIGSRNICSGPPDPFHRDNF